MKKLMNILPVILLGMPVFLFSQILKGPEQVLEKLYSTYGNKIILKPRIVIQKDIKNAAAFLRQSNVIVVSEKLIEVCRTFGPDSSSALAFVFGHEI
ncbi:MAG: hypothetical protein ABIO44_11680, partial [Saprospiraceae bacterium]